ncbi:hypothetical protein Mp_4g06410 [Marchantia polymorpha subsp. ruderalis]|uniref:Uncharacterized protein n=2 Tax=Marchantia polymorpha TaxID=3197 RepID=A0AAF6B6Z6_MARPO|nr:hypothetical protein MARPO_3228s0001 [Marchantia polymorpha]BBN07780.1 hypothetical protein Mp_4g06410 [Marchantia polymorpha subsp. ruderalis]|eukprot:PTQ26301.1 hypothetical protein MARPO_3228s0001 [Marchantia polymorpha]
MYAFDVARIGGCAGMICAGGICAVGDRRGRTDKTSSTNTRRRNSRRLDVRFQRGADGEGIRQRRYASGDGQVRKRQHSRRRRSTAANSSPEDDGGGRIQRSRMRMRAVRRREFEHARENR